MNNRTQQRFDRSIREAVAITKRAEERRAVARLAEHTARRVVQARSLLPTVKRALATGRLKGRALTKDQRVTLVDLLDEYTALLARHAAAATPEGRDDA